MNARRLACKLSLWMLTAALSTAAGASSTASSASSDASSASVSRLSDSVQASSRSSVGDGRVAEGEYRVVEVAAAAPETTRGRVRVTLAGLGEGLQGAEVQLWLPAAAPAARELAPGEVIAVRQRVYGLEFARGEPRRAFFLALHDAWWPELQTHAVPL